jgi:lipoyl-dependent peroxiredoxin
MATTRQAATVWHGTMLEGSGQVTLESSGVGTFDVTWASRAEQPEGRTSPEELIAAAHSSCFSMALSSRLAKAGAPAETLTTRAEVDFQPGEGITAVRLHVVGDVPGIDADAFAALAEDAKANCPVSKALAAVPITLTVG